MGGHFSSRKMLFIALLLLRGRLWTLCSREEVCPQWLSKLIGKTRILGTWLTIQDEHEYGYPIASSLVVDRWSASTVSREQTCDKYAMTDQRAAAAEEYLTIHCMALGELHSTQVALWWLVGWWCLGCSEDTAATLRPAQLQCHVSLVVRSSRTEAGCSKDRGIGVSEQDFISFNS